MRANIREAVNFGLKKPCLNHSLLPALDMFKWNVLGGVEGIARMPEKQLNPNLKNTKPLKNCYILCLNYILVSY